MSDDDAVIPEPRRVAVAVGGSAGHIHAALAIAEAYRDEIGARVCLVGPHETVNLGIVARSGFAFEATAAAPFARQSTLKRLAGLFSTAGGCWRSAQVLKRRRTEIAVGCGGYSSVPPLLAARALGIPVVVHESNASGGLANRLLDTIAARVLLGHEEAGSSFRSPSRVTGNPIMKERRRLACLRGANASTDPPLILVTGGSGGSPFLNQHVPAVLGLLQRSGIAVRVVHQTGVDDPNPTRELYRDSGIAADVQQHLDPMENYLGRADFAISSAGAITLAELELFAIPALVVPLPQAAWAHQTANAAIHARRTGAAWLTEETWSSERAAEVVSRHLRDLAARCGGQTHPKPAPTSAASLIVEECESVLGCNAERSDGALQHRPRASVLALGDLGRSPRMVQHALALDRHGWDVSLIGLDGRELLDAIESSEVRCVRLPSFDKDPTSPWSLTRAVVRMGRLGWRTLQSVFGAEAPDLILAQTPPVFPTAMIAVAAARVRGAPLWLDWHNLSYTVLENRSPGRSAVAALCAHERLIARFAHGHICVSDAMREFLVDRWGLQRVHVFRDAPAEAFRPRGEDEREPLRQELASQQGTAREFLAKTEALGRAAAWVVSASSWADDDAWQLLAPALAEYDRAADLDASLPRILMIFPGDGPRQGELRAELRHRHFNHVHCELGWLSHRNYAAQLAVADLGICLHRSTSGLDLPMKAWDMIGVALPFVAFDYGAVLSELEPRNAISQRFRSANELNGALQTQLRGYPNAKTREHRRLLRCGPQPSGFMESWARDVGPLFGGSLSSLEV